MEAGSQLTKGTSYHPRFGTRPANLLVVFLLRYSKSPGVVDHAKFFKALGQRVKQLRKRRGHTQEDMTAFGFSARHWQQIEGGRPITMKTLLKICDAFKVRIAVLLRGADEGIYRNSEFPSSFRKRISIHLKKPAPLAQDDSPSSSIGRKKIGRSFKVLVVDDFEAFRRFIRSVLRQKAEFQISEASDGLEAVQKAEELRPDLILMDIGLPRMNGLESARRVHRLVPSAKILFVSQESSLAVVREALGLGSGYVNKGRAQSDLLPAIDAVLSGKQFVSGEAQTPSTHRIVFCFDDAALLVGLTHFVASALSARNAAFVLATKSHQHALMQRLHWRGVDIDAAIQRGTYISLDSDKEPDPTRFIETIRGLSDAASKAGKQSPRVAIFGERAGRLWAEDKTDEAIRFEEFGNELARDHVIDILCAYPLVSTRENDPALKRIRAIHFDISF